ncbi:MAG: thioredoxin family protein [Candidatus Aminicenantes bacterium]|nr:thioredoxin family protein [Candidatus Aminicenantes bacterium]
MELLNQAIKEATRKKFETELVNPVRLIFFTQEPKKLILPDSVRGQECPFCQETRQLLEELAALSSKIQLEIHDFLIENEFAQKLGVDKIPAILVYGEKEYKLRFFGFPAGYEYGSLLKAIIQASQGKTDLQDSTRVALRKINSPIHIQVFVTPTCPYCPMAVELAHSMAIESPLIQADMIEASEFPHLVNKYHVFGVPKTIINETISLEGAVPENVFLENVLKAISQSSSSISSL